MRIFLLSTCLIVLSLVSAAAQTVLKGKITGQLRDEKQATLPFVNVMLVKAADSVLVKGVMSDTDGRFEFENVAEGKYRVTASMLGYQKLYTPAFTLNAANPKLDLAHLQMAVIAQNLKEVVVTAQKPFIEQKADKMVVNVENSIVSSGSTAMEVLEKSPGITVDKDDKISLKGKQGVIVMIDGKQTYLSATEVSNLLRNMQSNAIEQIEIITNPSAKYDAAGNSGIINIKLKKNKNVGTNGSVTLGAGYGKFPKANGGLNLNYRNQKFNLFGNYNYGYNKRYNSNDITRVVRNGDVTTIFDQYNFRPSESNNHSFKAGIDYYLDKKNTIGFLGTGFINDGAMQVSNDTWISSSPERVDSSIRLLNQSKNHWQSLTYNLNYKHTFDSTGRELTVDLDYSKFQGRQNDNIRNYYYNASGEEIRTPFLLQSNVPSVVSIRAFKSDYVHPLSKTAKMEAGVKSSYVTTDNDVRFDLYQNGDWVVDPTRTNHFKYTENINAAYLNYSQEFKKTSLQLGFRTEQTISKGNSITLNKIVDRNYWQFFPSVFLNRKLNKDHQLSVSYSRRIDRPSYQDLNPFLYFLDLYTYFQGNPFLKPQYTNSFQVSHTFKGAFITTLGYSHTTDVITQVTVQNDTTKVTRATMVNLNTLRNYNLGLSFPVAIAKWWTTNNNLNLFYNQYESNYLGGNLNNARFAFNFNTSHSITLPKGFTAEINGWYNSPSVEGIIRMQSMYAVGFGIQKSLMNKKASLKLNVNDLFNVMRFRGGINYQNMDLNIRSKWESRQVRLTFTYRFGNTSIKPASRKTSGSESEQNRVKMGG